MNFNIADLPAVRAQLERDVAAAQEAEQARAEEPCYARTPAAPGPQQTGARPAAIQRSVR